MDRTPPPPSVEERRKMGNEVASKAVLYTTMLVPAVCKYSVWIFTLCEVTVILANAYPSPISQSILSLLMHDADASTIRITAPFLVGCVMQVAGTFMRLACYQRLGRFFTFQPAVCKDHKLITSGPYSIVRHPSYAALIVLEAGNLLRQSGSGSWLSESGIKDSHLGWVSAYAGIGWMLSLLLGWMTAVAREDRVLRKEFGQEWEEWAKKTPYRLIPGIF